MFEVIECDTPEHFLESLAPVSRHFRSEELSTDTLLFRGCADASWRLLPTALRGADSRKLAYQVRLETDSLARFVSECDENGLPVPNDSEKLRAQMIRLNEPGAQPPLWLESGVTWPTDPWVALMALAQHSGLPTRLLDWTTSPFVGAYFAALPESNVSNPAQLAVWALSPFQADITALGGARRVIFAHQRSISKFIWMREWKGFAVVDTTRAGNPNLVAQRGYLTAHVLGAVPNEMWDAPWNESPLEDLLHEWDSPQSPRLKKFVLDRRHAPRVLDFLKRYGVSTAVMFPGYAGIVKSVLEKPQRGPHDL